MSFIVTRFKCFLPKHNGCRFMPYSTNNFIGSSNQLEQEKKRDSFLQSKKILPLLSTGEILYILRPDLASTNAEKQNYQRAQKRLDQLISAKDNQYNYIPKDVQTFEQFLKKIPVWGDAKKSYVFWRDDEKVKNIPDGGVLRQRAQLSGLCYIHGPDMLQYYLISRNIGKRSDMIDISQLIIDSFSSEQLLKEHIFEDKKGGSSLQMVERILEPNSDVFGSHSSLYEKHMKQYGPALVSQFKVHEDFHKADKSFYHEKPQGVYKGLHSMVLVGSRQENGKNYFLLQNWWKTMQFVEVDEEYSKKCGAIVSFVENPQTIIPNTFPHHSASPFTENITDEPERYLNESKFLKVGQI